MSTVTYSWVNKTPAFLVNTTHTSGTQTDPVAFGLSDGTYSGLWTSPVTGADVAYAQLTSTGDSLGGEGFLSGTPTFNGDQFDPAAVQLNNTVSVGTYTDNSSGTNQVWANRGGIFSRVDTSGFPDSDSAIAALSNGGFVVTWTQAFSGTDNDLIMELYDLNGAALGQHGVDTSATISTFHSSVAGLTGGGFVVAWEQHNKSDGSAPGVWFQRFDNSGGNLSTPHVQVGAADALGGVLADTQVKALHDGGFAVAWTGKSTAGNFNAIDLAIYNADGSVRAGSLTADPVAGINHDKPSIAVLSNGDFVVSWVDESSGTSGYQAFAPNGNKLGSAATIDSFVVKDSITSLSGASNGGLVASVFESSNAESAGTGDSIRSSVNELVRTTTTTAKFEPVTGDSLRDIIVVATGTNDLAGGANADTFKFGAFVANGQIADYDRGNTGSYDATEGDVIDLSALLSTAYAHGSGQAANTLVRVVAGAGQADLQVDTDGTANGTNWVHFETLLNLVVGNTVSVLLDATPGASPVTIAVDTPPSFGIITHSTLVVAENSNFSVNQTATDPDPGTTLTYSISGGTDADAFQLNAQTGALSFVSAHDFEHPTDSDQNNSYLVNVRAFDGAQFTDSFVTVNVTDVNETPVITSNGGGATASVSIAENTTAVTTVHATDPDAGTTLAYGISGGADAALFAIDPSTGVLSFIAAPDYESPADSDHNNSYIVQVTASDGALTASQTVTANVTDVNDNAPTITTGTTLPVPENTTTAAILTSSDADTVGIDPAAFSITGGDDAAHFVIVNGALEFTGLPDFENPADADHNNSYLVQVTASDGLHNVSSALAINVTDASDNAAPIAGDTNDNTLNGTSGNDTIEGGSGNETIFAGAGADTLNGGDGNDTLVGNGGGDDTFTITQDIFDGGNGSDTLYVKATDVIQGGAGRDFVHLVNDNPITINLGATGVEWIETLFGNDTINGASQTVGIEVYSDGGNDIITGSAFDDIVWSGSGNDTVTGGDGNDVIVGDVGADSISGGNGNDSLYVDASDTFIDGGAGHDAAYITAGASMTLDLAATHIEFVADFVPGGSDDTIDGSNATANLEVYAGAGTDIVKGGSSNDFLWGEAGNDTITGGAGNDTLVGGTGADTLTGGPGIDALYGNSGNGGDGAVDTFVFTPNWGTDFVFDFEHGIDKLDMTALGITFADLTFTNTPDGHCYINYGTNLIAVANHTTANVTASDFIF